MSTYIEPQVYDLASFCKAYSISRSFAYLEIKAGRLKPFKAGRKTLISRQSAETWRRGLEDGGAKPPSVSVVGTTPPSRPAPSAGATDHEPSTSDGAQWCGLSSE